jgi:hypothetical protein
MLIVNAPFPMPVLTVVAQLVPVTYPLPAAEIQT